MANNIERGAINTGATIGNGISSAVIPYNPNAIGQQQPDQIMTALPHAVSHIASNGYYGFAAISNDPNNNNNTFFNGFNYNCNPSGGMAVGGCADGVVNFQNPNNNIDIYVNGIPQNVGATSIGIALASDDAIKQQRNKKRSFAGSGGNDENFAGANGQMQSVCDANGTQATGGSAAKRCRVDQGDTDCTEQYFNDAQHLPGQPGAATCSVPLGDGSAAVLANHRNGFKCSYNTNDHNHCTSDHADNSSFALPYGHHYLSQSSCKRKRQKNKRGRSLLHEFTACKASDEDSSEEWGEHSEPEETYNNSNYDEDGAIMYAMTHGGNSYYFYGASFDDI